MCESFGQGSDLGQAFSTLTACISFASNNMVLASLSCPSPSHQPVLSSPNSWFSSIFLVPASGRLPWPHALSLSLSHTHTHILLNTHWWVSTWKLPSSHPPHPQTSKGSLFAVTSSLPPPCLAFQAYFSWGPLSLSSVASDCPHPPTPSWTECKHSTNPPWSTLPLCSWSTYAPFWTWTVCYSFVYISLES